MLIFKQRNVIKRDKVSFWNLKVWVDANQIKLKFSSTILR